MRTHKYIKASIFLVGFILTACGQDLKMKFYNKTGYDIDSLNIGGHYIGYLKRDNATNFIKYDSLDIQDGVPYGLTFYADGVIKGKKKIIEPTEFCGTGVRKEIKGIYEFDITLFNRDNGYILGIDIHK